MSSTHAHTTAQTVTQIILWCTGWKIRLTSKMFHCSKKHCNHHIDISKMSDWPCPVIHSGLRKWLQHSSLRQKPAYICHQQEGKFVRHHVQNCFCYFWEEGMKVTRLVWSQVSWDDSGDKSQVGSICRIQMDTHWREPPDPEISQKQGSAHCRLCASVYWTDRQPGNPDSCSCKWRHQEDVQWHKKQHCDQPKAEQPLWNLPQGK